MRSYKVAALDFKEETIYLIVIIIVIIYGLHKKERTGCHLLLQLWTQV